MKLMGISWATEVKFISDDMAQLVSGPLILVPYTELGDLRGYLREKRSETRASNSGNSYVIMSNVS